MTQINFAGIVDNSTLDYPDEVCAVIYLCGCPFRCPWCQNPELLDAAKSKVCRKVELDFLVEKLKENFLIGAVTIIGGEPLMQKETLEVIKKIKKETKLKIKLDTNCYYPERLKESLPYLDSFATDIKAPMNQLYGKVVGLPDRWRKITEEIEKSLEILKSWKGFKEARTTIVPGLIDTERDIEEIAKIVHRYNFNIYTLQQFRADKTLDERYENLPLPSPELMKRLGKAAKKILPKTKVRIVTQQHGFEEIKL